MGGRRAGVVNTKQASKSSVSKDEFAAYAFDMLQSLRESSKNEHHRFLSYLIGMAAEEALRLAEGQPSALAAYSKTTATPVSTGPSKGESDLKVLL
jgi:hypothetical protein